MEEVKQPEPQVTKPIGGGFGLKAPPKSSQHVLLDNVRNLNKKLKEGDDGKEEGDELMNMLMDIDFSGKKPEPQAKDNNDLI